MNRIGLFAGSFDPITNGHIDLIQRSSKMFDKLYVCVTNNIQKKTKFSIEERFELTKNVVESLNLPNVEVIKLDNVLTIKHAKKLGVKFLVRSVRTSYDIEREMLLSHNNIAFDSTIETILILCSSKNAHISSSYCWEIAHYKEPISHLVPKMVEQAMLRKIKELSSEKR
ncbi:MAG: pantetheine-phosphate adenylyltransferase [Mycoplasma sp.]